VNQKLPNFDDRFGVRSLRGRAIVPQLVDGDQQLTAVADRGDAKIL
jgi:hypothetical protein